MNSRTISVAVALAMLFMPFSACSKSKKGVSIQEPVVAGGFYPADPSTLKKMVDTFIEQAPKKTFDGTLIGLVAPHAGYQYSGPIAAAAFKQLEGRSYKRVVVMAGSHRVPFAGAALSTRDLYRTPLGDIPIDTEAVQKLIKGNPWAKDDQRPYEVEHSLEVELPFLQAVLKGFKLVPMIIGIDDQTALDAIADALNTAFPGDDTLFVASTDLSHYMTYDVASELDRKTISSVTEKDAKAYYDDVQKEAAQLCGNEPVYIMKRIAEKRGASLKLIQYANSGDTTGDRSRVVGYGAIAVVKPQSQGLDDKQKKELLKLARDTVTAHITGKKLPPLPNDPVLNANGAAFVTLKERGQLRGCIGHIIAIGPLNKCVQDVAVAAASEDPRFPPVKPEELKDISIEISVLTPPERLPDPLAVRVGTDGLIIKKGFNQGVLLPQVPTEQGWTKERFLEGICEKAGLPPGSWKDAELYRFQAIVFGE